VKHIEVEASQISVTKIEEFMTKKEGNELFSGIINAGNHNFVWDGTDHSGRTVSSGIYFARIESGKQKRTHKMMLVK
jgi:flagellar hook assembly protein FlgD